MFKVVFVESGGKPQERSIDVDELTIGRDEASSIVLSRPNVSKRHASVRVVDQKMVLVDYRSTNGTFINGKRIQGPTEFGPQDSVDVGDFRFRISFVRPVRNRRPVIDMSEVAQERPAEPIEPPPNPPTEELSAVSLPPIEDADELVEEVLDEVLEEQPVQPPPPKSVIEAARPEAPDPVTVTREAFLAAAEVLATEVFGSIDAGRTEFSDKEWAKLGTATGQVLDRMNQEGRLPAHTDLEGLRTQIMDAFLSLGPIRSLMLDPGVHAVVIDGPDSVSVVRRSGIERMERLFLNDLTLERVLAKLARQAGVPREASTLPHLRGFLPDGTHLEILRPPIHNGGSLVALERRFAPTAKSSDALVASGVLTQDQWSILADAIEARRNVVFCGPPRCRKTSLLANVLPLVPKGSRIVVLERLQELSLFHANLVGLSKSALCSSDGPGPDVLMRLYPDTIVISDIGPEDVPTLTSLGLTRFKGLLCTVVADSAESCLRGLELLFAFSHPNAGADNVRELVRRLVDLVVVLGDTRDGASTVIEMVDVGERDGMLRRLS